MHHIHSSLVPFLKTTDKPNIYCRIHLCKFCLRSGLTSGHMDLENTCSSWSNSSSNMFETGISLGSLSILQANTSMSFWYREASLEPCTEHADFSGARMMNGMLAYSPGKEGMLHSNTSGREENHSNHIRTAVSLPLCKALMFSLCTGIEV